MVLTVLEANVAPDRIADLEQAYKEGASELPPDIIETFLVRDSNEPTLFRIITLWKSWEALHGVRSSGVKPKGVQMFEAAGATPELSILDVVVRRSQSEM